MHVSPRALVVEFAGLPGAGKTIVAAHTQRALVARGLSCSIADGGISAAVPSSTRAVRRVALAAAELAAHPRRGVAAVRGVRATGQSSARDALASTVQWLAVQRLMARARGRAGTHLVEEGPLQTLWTLGLRSASDMTAGILPALMSDTRPDLVIVVEAPLSLVSARLGVRSSRHSRTQRLPEPERTAELLRGSELLHGLLRGAGGEQLLIRNDGTATVAELGRGAAEWVLRTAVGVWG